MAGEGYDRCGSCDKESDAKFFGGGEHQRKTGGQLDWSIYHCAPDNGGCGANWSRATKQGLERRTAQGSVTRGLTPSASLDRVNSVPSDQFRERYALIDWGR